MFDQNQPGPQSGYRPPAAPPSATTPPQETFGAAQQGSAGKNASHVYTMPQQFMPPEQKKKEVSSKQKTMFIWIGVVVAVLLIIAAIVVAAFQIANRPQVVAINTTGDVVNSTANTNTQTTNANENANTNTNATNGNQNDNENGNANSGGTLLNLTVNEDLNENINSGLFPTNTNNSNGNTNSAGTELLPDRSRVQDARDKDRDELTDIEENIYETDPTLPDTDKDGFIDGSEVANLFAPDVADKSLLATGSVIEYKNKQYGWSIYYPALWIAEPTSNANTEVLFTADSVDGEFVQVIVSENTRKQTAAKWFASLYADVEPSDLDTTTIGGVQGITTPDGFTTYIADDDYIIGIIYNFGAKEKISFRTTYQMMLESFAYTPPPRTQTNENANGNTNATTNTNSTNTPGQNTNNTNTTNTNSTNNATLN